MEIKYFKLIKTIVEEGNIANSSEKLFLTQSAISHQLKEMEERLQFKVFYRNRNQWKLTDEGVELYQLANTLLKKIEDGFQKIKDIQNGSNGKIKFSTECYSFYYGLPSFLQKMAILYPNIKVNLILEATHKPISKILLNEIDIAIVSTKPTNNNLISIKFFKDEIFAIMHKENKLNTNTFLSAEDFLKTHLIIHSYPLETVFVYQNFLLPNKKNPSKISAIPLTEVSLEMVKANMGIMCMPKWALKSFNLPNELLFKQIGKNGLKRTHYMVFRKADKSKKYISDFISNFKEHILNN